MLTANAIRPDKRRFTDKEENPKHFIDIGAYGEDAVNNMPANWQTAIAKYSLDTLKRYGYVPHEILLKIRYLQMHLNKKIQTVFCFMQIIQRILRAKKNSYYFFGGLFGLFLLLLFGGLFGLC